MESYRVHGKGSHKYDNERIGLNSRLDTLQAAILIEKLAIYADELDTRERVAHTYSRELAPYLNVPAAPAGRNSVWAQYTVKAKTDARSYHLFVDMSHQKLTLDDDDTRPPH